MGPVLGVHLVHVIYLLPSVKFGSHPSCVNFPGLTSGAFLRMQASLVRNTSRLSFPRKRESRFDPILWIPARADIASLAGMTTRCLSEPDPPPGLTSGGLLRCTRSTVTVR